MGHVDRRRKRWFGWRRSGRRLWCRCRWCRWYGRHRWRWRKRCVGGRQEWCRRFGHRDRALRDCEYRCHDDVHEPHSFGRNRWNGRHHRGVHNGRDVHVDAPGRCEQRQSSRRWWRWRRRLRRWRWWRRRRRIERSVGRRYARHRGHVDRRRRRKWCVNRLSHDGLPKRHRSVGFEWRNQFVRCIDRDRRWCRRWHSCERVQFIVGHCTRWWWRWWCRSSRQLQQRACRNVGRYWRRWMHGMRRWFEFVATRWWWRFGNWQRRWQCNRHQCQHIRSWWCTGHCSRCIRNHRVRIGRWRRRLVSPAVDGRIGWHQRRFRWCRCWRHTHGRNCKHGRRWRRWWRRWPNRCRRWIGCRHGALQRCVVGLDDVHKSGDVRGGRWFR